MKGEINSEKFQRYICDVPFQHDETLTNTSRLKASRFSIRLLLVFFIVEYWFLPFSCAAKRREPVILMWMHTFLIFWKQKIESDLFYAFIRKCAFK